MNESPSESSSVLSFSCPRCGHEHEDEYEVIDAARPTCCLANCFPASQSRSFVMRGERSAGLGHRVSEVGG
jgi:hypothetical protein